MRLLFLALAMVALVACDHPTAPLSKLNLDNFNQVSTGMTKAQVERILGPPTSAETKDMLIFKKTTYRYEDGTRFIQVTFKNDECDGKDSNLGTQ